MNWTKISAVCLLCLGLAACNAANQESGGGLTELTTDSQQQCYAVGMDIAGSLDRTGMELDIDALVQGLRDGLTGGDSLLTREQCVQAKNDFQTQAREKMMAKQQEDAAKGQQEGDAFLAKNREAEGVTVTESGLQYKIISAGDGPLPKATDTVSVHYHGTLINGSVFDSSVERGEPATFQVGRVISGWTEALQLMPVGSKWKLFIPADLAYGPRSPSPDIPPNSVLIFDVELLGIEGSE